MSVRASESALEAIEEAGDVHAASIGDLLYVPGGWNVAGAFLNDLVAYNVVTGNWSARAPMHAPRGDMALAALDGRLFAVGGEMWSGQTYTCDWGNGPEECALHNNTYR